MKKILIIGIILIASTMAMALEDPLEIGIGARPMGMGKAFVAVADDGSAIFMNPAGLADISYWKFFSMYTRLLNDIYYFSTSLSYPFPIGTLAVGYVGSGVDQIIIPTQSGIEFFNYHSNVVLLSIGKKITSQLKLGGNLKLFSKGYLGAVATQGGGWDVDLGVKYSWTDWISLGLSCQNVVPFSMGAKIIWDSGLEESIPLLVKPGVAVKYKKATFLLDADWAATRKNLPTPLHFGVEYKLMPSFYVRGGIDQVISAAEASGLSTNLTLGLSLNLYSFRVDYAYHPYHDETGNVTHYVSFSNLPPPAPEIIPRPEVVEDIIIDKPEDKTITYDDKIEISGKHKNIVALKVAGSRERITGDGFTVAFTLHYGKNIIDLEGETAQRKIIKRWISVVRLRKFTDVPQDYWARKPIECLNASGVIRGYPDDSFKGEEGVTRAEFATMLLRVLEREPESKDRAGMFSDISGHWAETCIDAVVRLNLFGGYPDGTFKPNRHITRAEAIQVICKLENLKFEPAVKAPYLDVDALHWAAKAISAAKSAGLLEYIKVEIFRPEEQIRRCEIAEILSRTKLGQDKIYKTFCIPYDNIKLPPHPF